VKNLSLIDCRINGLNCLINALDSRDSLEQLIVIFNQDVVSENDVDSQNSDDDISLGSYRIVNELESINLSKFNLLQYFELSLYNDVTDNPWVSAEDVRQIAEWLPVSIREACIYS
jgi:hypothetical protein